jgi:hypothetical protein
MTAVLRDVEKIFRSAVFPVAFKRKQLSTKGFLKLYRSDESPFILEMSVAWQRFVPTVDMVHHFGCRLAAAQNKNRISAEQKADRIYCGSYGLTAGDVRGLVGMQGLAAVSSASVLHKIEDGEIAHANCTIKVDTGGDEDAVETVKTAIVDRLWSLCQGPSRYVCSHDTAVDPHPSVLLQEAPLGPYRDPRSFSERSIDVLFCHLIYTPLALLENYVSYSG